MQYGFGYFFAYKLLEFRSYLNLTTFVVKSLKGFRVCNRINCLKIIYNSLKK
jgi:hypothetical protein